MAAPDHAQQTAPKILLASVGRQPDSARRVAHGPAAAPSLGRVSRPEEFHLPASRRTVREPLDSHRSHQANVFVPAFQCTNSPGFSRVSFLTKRLARVL